MDLIKTTKKISIMTIPNNYYNKTGKVKLNINKNRIFMV